MRTPAPDKTKLALCALAAVLAACAGGAGAARDGQRRQQQQPASARLGDAAPANARDGAEDSGSSSRESRAAEGPGGVEAAARNTARVAHVFVALCDNVHQGIVPVAAHLGDGDSPATNLYWGAAYGVKTFFRKSKDWRLVAEVPGPRAGVLQRLVFRHRARDAYLVADAYRGREIERCTLDFLEAAAGAPGETIEIDAGGARVHTAGSAGLVAYVGHDGLMDFTLPRLPRGRDGAAERPQRDAVVLACASKQFFAGPLRAAGARPLLWTTNLMAPEAYVLSAALDGWLAEESGEQVRARAAAAYHKYQRCGLRAATKLFATGF